MALRNLHRFITEFAMAQKQKTAPVSAPQEQDINDPNRDCNADISPMWMKR